MSKHERLRELEKSDVWLLVEGANDLYFVAELMKKHGVDYDAPCLGMPWIKDTRGLSLLLAELEVVLRVKRHLGLILDADTVGPAGRWTEVKRRLEATGWTAPNSLPAEGLVLTNGGGRRVGVWLMPKNETEGYLESLVAELIPSGDPTWNFAKAKSDEARRMGAPFREDLLDRASLYTWLAWRETPGRPIGEAIARRWLDANAPSGQVFASWFKRLFTEAMK